MHGDLWQFWQFWQWVALGWNRTNRELKTENVSRESNRDGGTDD
jgi:hypothetical protein